MTNEYFWQYGGARETGTHTQALIIRLSRTYVINIEHMSVHLRTISVTPSEEVLFFL